MIDRGGIDTRLAETGPLMNLSGSHIDGKVGTDREVRRLMRGPVQPVLLERLGDSFDQYLISLGQAPKTINTYTKVAARFVKLAEGQGVDLMAASPSEVADVMALIPDTPSTRRMYRSAALHWWAYMGRPDPPVKAIRVPRPPRGEFKGLEPAEAGALTETATGWFPEGTAVLFGLYMGLRREEIATVRWDRFDPDLERYTGRATGWTSCWSTPSSPLSCNRPRSSRVSLA